MNYIPVFEQIESLLPRYLSVWQECCELESPTVDKAAVDRCGQYFIDFAKQHGWKTEVLEQPVSGNAVCITMNPEIDAKPLALSGHIDTVHPIGLFGKTPVRIEGDTIYGPGVCDCKGGIVAALLAMDALEKCGYKQRPVQLLLQSDEEVGSKLSKKATINWMCEKAKDAIAFLNLEGATPGNACLQRKGIITYRLIVTGKEAHASRCATEGASAILDAAHKIIELEKLKDAEGLTCNVGTIEGGNAANTVPGKCEILANIRFATQDQLEWVKGYVKAIAQTVHVKGCTCELKQESFRVAMEYHERNVQLLEHLNSCFTSCGMDPLAASKSTGGSDAADVTVYGIPCIDNLGVLGSGIHSVRECAPIPSLLQSAKWLAAAALGL
ncbi:MAG: M20/M25/M40 family metallo-hydrolase [Clostridia bacterium]|nr:M20/M25/M40 family metallo-hydrolase [Clostridia bacterium]